MFYLSSGKPSKAGDRVALDKSRTSVLLYLLSGENANKKEEVIVIHTLAGKSFAKMKGIIPVGTFKGMEMWRLYLSGRFDMEAEEDLAVAPPEWNVTIEKEGVVHSVDLAIREELNQAETSAGNGLLFVNVDGLSYACCFTPPYEEIVGVNGGMCRHCHWSQYAETNIYVPITEGSELGGTMSYYHRELASLYWVGYNIRVFLILKP